MGVDWSTANLYANQDIDLHVPTECAKCGGKMVFKGVGEYQCERCGFLDYDDYGKVRACVEANPGINISEAEEKTGVSQHTIRKLLKEGRMMLTEDSKVMMHCEKCGKRIRIGRLCPECEAKLLHFREQLEKSHGPHSDMRGYAVRKNDAAKGEKRYRSDGNSHK